MNFSTLTPGYYLEWGGSDKYILCQILANDGEYLTITDLAPISGFTPNSIKLANNNQFSYNGCASCTYFPVSSSTPLSLAEYQSLYPEHFI